MTFSPYFAILILTIMKKVIWILIFLLSILNLPAETPVGKSISVELILELQKNPQYYIGLTNVPITKKDDFCESKEIYLTESVSSNNTILNLADVYYISYYFEEFERVSFSVQLSGDMVLSTKTKDWDNTEKIPYTLILKDTSKDESTTIKSSDTSEIVLFDTKDISDDKIIDGCATTLGQVLCGSYSLSLMGNTSTVGNKMGTYKSQIVVNVKSSK